MAPKKIPMKPMAKPKMPMIKGGGTIKHIGFNAAAEAAGGGAKGRRIIAAAARNASPAAKARNPRLKKVKG